MRTSRGLIGPPFSHSPLPAVAAGVARQFLARTNPDGDDPFARLAGAGSSFSRAGENIARNRSLPGPTQAAVNAWMASDGHRANIL
ncbi:MAG: hypothetical protein AB1486_16130 [Planctomycetota bacterium]